MPHITECALCEIKDERGPYIFYEDQKGLFRAGWDPNPVNPGHALVIPKRHVQFFRDLNDDELENFARVVQIVKNIITNTKLDDVYQQIAELNKNENTQAFLRKVLPSFEKVTGRQPDAFNDGLNDGPAAGQTVPHLHWHVIPRWEGDIEDPRGGIRNFLPDRGNYWGKP